MLVLEVFTQVLLPILIMFGAGWVLDRKWRVDLATVVKLNINLFVPAFIFYELTTKQVEGRLAWLTVAFTLSVVIVLFTIAALVAWWRRYSLAQTRSLQMAAVFYNSANYGVPLMHLAFPGPAETLQVFVILVQNIGNFTLGVFLVSSTKTPGWRALLPMFRQTSFWAVMLGLAMRGIFGAINPELHEGWRWFWTPLRYFHDGLVAVALVTLGVQLSKTSARATLPRLGWALGLRLLVGPLVGWVLAVAFGFEGEILLTMILSTSFPTAVNTALIAHEFKADTEDATRRSVLEHTLQHDYRHGPNRSPEERRIACPGRFPMDPAKSPLATICARGKDRCLMPPPAAAQSAFVFQVAGTPLALRVSQVREVVPLAALQTVPEMPRVIVGFLELDRDLIPIVRIEELLRLDLRGRDWSAERTLDHHIVVAIPPASQSAGWIEHGTSLIPLRQEDLARLPPGHSLNNCAQFVIPRPPPEPSLVLLEMDRLLLEKERVCVRDLRERVEERLMAVRSGGE